MFLFVLLQHYVYHTLECISTTAKWLLRKTHTQNDLLCVEWNIKLYTLTHILIWFDFLCSLDFTGLLSESQSGLVIQVTHVAVLYVFMCLYVVILPCVRINDDDDDMLEYLLCLLSILFYFYLSVSLISSCCQWIISLSVAAASVWTWNLLSTFVSPGVLLWPCSVHCSVCLAMLSLLLLSICPRLSELFCAMLYATFVPSHMHTHMSSSYKWTRPCFGLSFCTFSTITSLFVIGLFLCFFVYYLFFSLVVSISTIDCLESLVSKVTYYVSSMTINSTYLLTYLLTFSNSLLAILFGQCMFAILCKHLMIKTSVVLCVIIYD